MSKTPSDMKISGILTLWFQMKRLKFERKQGKILLTHEKYQKQG